MRVQQGMISARSSGLAPEHASRNTGLFSRFCRDEDGSLLIFGVYVFVLILMVGGIGIDLMRFERDRSELQYTLDRAVLAAADLDQTLDPKAVVHDYFDKAELSGSLKGEPVVTEGLGFRKVSASASAEVDTQFMHMTGLDTLIAPAAATAEERIDGVEISLVLDVSGSMNSNSRIQNLKVAARDFIDTMVDNTEDGKMSISIIPYATQVSMSESFFEFFNTAEAGNDRVHDYSYCLNFTAADFYSTSVTTTQLLKQTLHFDPWNTSDRRDNGTLVLDPVCEDATARQMLIMQKDRTKLKNFISNLSAGGNTSIDVGMKWGTALLDPALRTVVGAMIATGDVDAAFVARPLNFTDPDVLKVVVLMTDGQNTQQYYINNGFRTGNSNIWWNQQQKRYSVWVPAYGKYFWPHSPYGDNKWATQPLGTDGVICYSNYSSGYSSTCVTNGSASQGTEVRLTYPELWSQTPVQANARDNYRPWMGTSSSNNEWVYDVRSYFDTNEKDDRTADICAAAKAEDVIVFTIGFEAPYSGRQVLKDCASSDAHYFDVSGLEISEAFASIATSIRKLRLTQ